MGGSRDVCREEEKNLVFAVSPFLCLFKSQLIDDLCIQ